MCGIAGLIVQGGVDADLASRLGDALAHRGPDDHGYAGWWPGGRLEISADPTLIGGAQVVLIHRRLSILDLTAAGRQPMLDASATSALICNGEIYNFRRIAASLPGFQASSGSDSEVALAALVRHGREALAAFRGMFALAHLDAQRGRLLVARDPFGIKPLYLASWRDGLAFASEPQALLHLPGIDRQADHARLRDFLVDGASDHGGRTFFAGIRQLPPGHLIELDLQAARSWPDAVASPTASPSAPAPLRQLLEHSVALHLRADVPLGFSCSGGLDSTAIIGLARQLEPDRPFHAIAFDDGETPWIRLAAETARCSLHVVAPDDATAAQALDRFLDVQGEPPLSASMLAEFLVYRRAREVGLKVLLDGQGADELFAGYEGFIGARVAGMLQHGRAAAAFALTHRASRGRRLRLRTILADAWRSWHRHGPQRYRRAAPWIRTEAFVTKFDPVASQRDPLRDQLRWSLTRDTLPTYLRSTDRSAMAHGIENRVPFLLPELAAHAQALAPEQLIDSSGTTKVALRAAVRDLVPGPILHRRDKIGFTCPEGRWLRASAAWVEQVVGDPMADSATWLDAPRFRRATSDFLAGARSVHPAWWRTLVVLDWMRRRGIRP